MRANAAAAGRNPDDIKLLFLCSPIVDTTMDAALSRSAILDLVKLQSTR